MTATHDSAYWVCYVELYHNNWRRYVRSGRELRVLAERMADAIRSASSLNLGIDLAREIRDDSLRSESATRRIVDSVVSHVWLAYWRHLWLPLHTARRKLFT